MVDFSPIASLDSFSAIRNINNKIWSREKVGNWAVLFEEYGPETFQKPIKGPNKVR